MRVSVLIRFKDEAQHLPGVLQAVASQEVPGVEVRIVGIDNESRDGSRAIMARYAHRIIEVSDYQPGKALNRALALEECDHACVLSAHAIPASKNWLSRLLAAGQLPDTLAVYGAQLYNVHSKFLDKRDLDLFSTTEPRVEWRDSDFWNANSLFPRASWAARKFDERVFELEDHHWTKMLLDGRRCVRFVPEALVYHYTHLQRNDRTFLPPSTLTNHQRLAQAIETLESAVADWPDTMAAALTLKSLAHLPAARAAVPILIDLLHNHADFDVRWRVAGTLAKLPCAEGIDALIAALGDPSFYPRDEAAWALAEIGSRAATVLLEKLGLVPPAEHPLAALALGRSRYARAEEHALAMINQGMKSADNDQRRNFAYAAGEIDCARGVAELLPGLHGLLTDPDDRIKSVAVWALGALAPRVGRSIDWRAVRRLSREHPDPLVRTEAVAALGKQICASRGSSLMRDLLLAAEDGAARVRFVATQSLRLIAEDGGRFARAGLGPDPDFGVRFEQELLEMILERQPARPTERRL